MMKKGFSFLVLTIMIVSVAFVGCSADEQTYGINKHEVSQTMHCDLPQAAVVYADKSADDFSDEALAVALNIKYNNDETLIVTENVSAENKNASENDEASLDNNEDIQTPPVDFNTESDDDDLSPSVNEDESTENKSEVNAGEDDEASLDNQTPLASDGDETPGGMVFAGQKVVLSVTAASVSDMYGYQFHVKYDKNEFEYAGGLKSKVNAISTIFAKPIDGHQLVGATMVGDKPGVSADGVAICQMEFVALKDCVLAEASLRISQIDVVSSALEYDENVTGWSCWAETK